MPILTMNSLSNKQLAELHRDVLAEAKRRRIELGRAMDAVAQMAEMTLEELQAVEARVLSLDEQRLLIMLIEHRKVERAASERGKGAVESLAPDQSVEIGDVAFPCSIAQTPSSFAA